MRDADPVGLRWQLGTRGPELARIVPEIAEILGGGAEPTAPDDEHGRFRLFDAVCGFLAEASRSRPIVIVLDDLHWADTSSLDLMHFVAQQLAETRLLLVGAYRDAELGQKQSVSTVLGEIAASDRARTITLEGLDEAGVASLIEATAGVEPSKALVRGVWERTEGNPFFVGEVVRLLKDDGAFDGPLEELPIVIPRGARDAVTRRLDALSPEVRSTLTIAAVAGREFEPAVVELASGRSAGEVAGALGQALEARLITEHPNPEWLSFAHAIVREAIYAQVGAANRADLHGRVGEAIEAVHGTDHRTYLDDLARHFFEAAPAAAPDKAIEYALRAAERATEQLAHEDAAGHYGRALELLAGADEADDAAACG